MPSFSRRRRRDPSRQRTLLLERFEDRRLLAIDLMQCDEIDPESPSNAPQSPEKCGHSTKASENEIVAAIRSDDPIEMLEDFLADEENAELRELLELDGSWAVVPQGDGIWITEIEHTGAQTQEELNAIMRMVNEIPGVEWVAPNYEFEGDPREFLPNDPLYGSQYHHPLMQNDKAWDIETGDASVIVAVTDDGVYLNHPDLNDNIWTNPGEIPGNGEDDDGNGFIDDVNGWDFNENDNNPNPRRTWQRHGTHVAGIAAGEIDNGVGIAGTAGSATIMPIRFYGTFSWTSTMVAASYRYAVDNGAQIINTSYNVDGFVNDPTFRAGLEYMYDNGGLHFNSAGNGNQESPPRYDVEQSIYVASTDWLDRRSSFSNYGIGTDISAPGSSILSSVPTSSYRYFSGTSMATPNAAGVAALIWSHNPSWTREQVVAQMMATADNIDAQNPGYEGKLGAGRVNSYRALTETLAAAPTVTAVDGLPADGADSNDQLVSSFGVSFSQLVDPASANDISNYELRAAGADATFDTADDVVYILSLPDDYMIGTNVLDIDILDSPLELGQHRLTITSGGIENPFGTDLDGDTDGTAGGDHVQYFNILQPEFVAIQPSGSLAYGFENEAYGRIAVGGETDSYTLLLDPGQKISVAVDPSLALKPTISIYNQDGGLIGSSTGGASGENTFLQSVPTHGQLDRGGPKAQLYRVDVGGADGTTGGYSVQIFLNAALEEEQPDQRSNDTLETAIDIDAVFLPLHGSVVDDNPEQPEIAVIMGNIGGIYANEDFESGGFSSQLTTNSTNNGRIQVIPPVGSGNDSSYALMMDTNPVGPYSRNEAILTVDLSGVSQANLSFRHASIGDERHYLPYTYTGSWNGDGVSISDDGVRWRRLIQYPSGLWRDFNFDLDAAATAAGMTLGADFKVKFQQFDQWELNFDGRGWDDIVVTGNEADWYKFDLEEGESSTLAASGANLELYDAGGHLLAIADGEGRINNFFATSDATFYAKLTGGLDADYSLAVTINADLDNETNDANENAQDLISSPAAGRRWAAGRTGKAEGTGSQPSDPVSLGRTLFDGTGFRWDMSGNGSIGDGTSDAYDGGHRNTDFGWFGTAQTEDNGREIVIGPYNRPNVSVTRKVYIPEDQGFARFLEVVTNTTASETSYTVPIYTNLGSDGGTVIVGTSSGDTSFDASDMWLVSDDFSNGGGDPTLIHVTHGPGGVAPVSASAPTGAVFYNYDLTLQPGETQIVMHFGSQNANRAEALAKAPQLVAGQLGALNGMTSEELSMLVNFSISDPGDRYRIDVNGGSTIEVETRTPGRRDGIFTNELDPIVRIYDEDGNMVAEDDNGSRHGQNAKLRHRVGHDDGGTYYVEVASSPATEEPTAGEYLVSVKQSTGALPAFMVTGTDIAEDARLRGVISQITVDFNDSILLTSLEASDLTVNGAAATGLTLIDANTVRFDLPALGEGDQNVEIAAGALSDLQNTPVDAFSMSFYHDITAPRIVDINIQQGDVIEMTESTHDLTYEVTFSEPMRVENLDNGDLNLRGFFRNINYVPSSATYNGDGTKLTLTYDDLPEDRYRLILFSGNGRFEDTADPNGWNLDGEPVAFPIPSNQTGNGFEGGNFFVDFDLDVGTAAYPTPLTPKAPLGSLIYDPVHSGYISPSGDTDSFTLNVDPGQTITVLVDPNSTLRPSIELLDPSDTTVATSVAAAAGDNALIQTVATVAGTYTMTVSGAAGTVGGFDLQVVLNAALETESHGGTSNGSRGTAQDIDGSFTALLKGATRGAVLGTTELAGHVASQTQLNELYYPKQPVFTFAGLPMAIADVTLTSDVISDFSSSSEYVDYYIDGASIGRLHNSGSDCNRDVETLTIPQALFNAANADNSVSIRAVPSRPVNSFCQEVHTVQLVVPDGTGGDWYSFSVDAGESVTLAATQLSGGNLSLQLWDNVAGSPLATSAGGSNNVGQLIYDHGPLAAGTYFARVGGVPGTAYSLLVTEAAVFDRESNDTLATAQPFGNTNVSLGYVGGGGEPVVLNAIDSGWYEEGSHNPSNTNYVVGLLSGDEFRDFFVFDLSSVAGSVADATLEIFNPSRGYRSPDPTETYQLQDVESSISDLRAGGFRPDIFADLGDGNTYGSVVVGPSDNNSVVSIDLNASALADINSSTGSQFAIGGKLTTLAGSSTQFVFGFSNDLFSRRLVLRLEDPADYYSFSAIEGQTIDLFTRTPADGPGEFVNTLDPVITLYDAAGTLVASGADLADGRNEQILYTVPTGKGGTYYVAVTAENGTRGEYILDPAPVIADEPVSAAKDLLIANLPVVRSPESQGALNTPQVVIAPNTFGQSTTLGLGIPRATTLRMPASSSTEAVDGTNTSIDTLWSGYERTVNHHNATQQRLTESQPTRVIDELISDRLELNSIDLMSDAESESNIEISVESESAYFAELGETEDASLLAGGVLEAAAGIAAATAVHSLTRRKDEDEVNERRQG